MSRIYKFHNPEGVYFVSFAVVEWIDVFTRNEYKDILLDSLRYCQQEKGMEIYAWCIMYLKQNNMFIAIDYAGEKGLLNIVLILSVATRCNRAAAGVQARWDAVYGKGNKDFLCSDATCDVNLEAIATDLDFSMQISLTFWKANNISNIAKDTSEETIKTITYKINGAYIGLPNRKQYTTKAYEVLKK